MNNPSRSRLKFTSRAAIVASAFGLALASLADTPVTQTRGKATIAFPFVASSTQCPAGSYDFESDGTKVTLRSTDPKGTTVVMLVVTRLGRHDKDKGAEFVFDKVGDQMKLSEIWPSKQDGYLVLVSPEAHEHRVVGGSSPHE
jgi:hypothetical protein